MHWAPFSNILLETFVPNLVFPTCPNLQILGKSQTGVFPNSRFLVKSLIKVNCHNSRTSDDIDMKLGTVTKLYKKKTTRKKHEDDVISKIVTSMLFFQFMANLEQSGSRIPDAESTKFMFSLIVIFYLI